MIVSEETREYRAVALHYEGRTARRSGERLIKHIDDGLRILVAIGASQRAMRASCLHPLVQADADLASHYERLAARSWIATSGCGSSV